MTGTTTKLVSNAEFKASIGLLGLVVGLAFGWIMTKGLSSDGLVFQVPWRTLILCLIVAAIVGVLAGVWPARRASRLRVLDALSYE